MRSKFSFPAYLVGLMAVVFTVMIIGVLSGNVLNPTLPLIPFSTFSLFFLFTWVWLLFGELRTKTISLIIENETFTVKKYFGSGIAKRYYRNEITGFKTSVFSSKSGDYEYLYLMAGDKKVAKVSEFYHSNYNDLKRDIISMKIKNLGYERFSYLREVKEIFTS